MKKYILIGLLAITTIACQKVDDSELNLSLIHQGNLYGGGDENITQENLVIDKEADWEELLAKIDAVNPESDNFSETEIDFDEYVVIACFDKVRNSGGFSIAIDDTEVTNKKVIFHVIKSESGPIVTQVITQPYYIAKFPRTNKKITFKD